MTVANGQGLSRICVSIQTSVLVAFRRQWTSWKGKLLSGEENDEELLRLMADARKVPLAEAAWAQFYLRHKKYLFAVLLRAHGRDLGEARIVEIVQDTLLRAYERARTYRTNEAAADRNIRRHRVRAWLGTIAENILRDSFRDEPQVIFMDGAELEAEHDVPIDDRKDCSPSPELERFERALNELSSREQEVLRVTGFWYRPGQSQQRIPNKVMTQLAADLGTTAENIRQIRARAIKALRKSMESHGTH